jgi:hypothetical protein
MKGNFCDECNLLIAPAETYVKVSDQLGKKWQWKLHTGCYRKFALKKPGVRLHPRLARG